MNVTGAGSARPWPRDVLLGGILVGVFVLAALLAPWLAPCDPAAQRLEQRLEGPSAAHPLGLDELGRDILSRLLHGARVSLLVGLAVVALAGLFGGAAGALAGWAGGAVDAALMRLADVVLAFPGILLAIALVGVLGPALRHLVLALVAIGWVGYARLLRAQVLAWREREFVLAGRALGLPGWR
ncbi:MAG TPA: ABC transporter permease, partial [Thermoanaerobaculia bacterium]|nr:ABC transporter permease [Thermoanaerobaculia bacterium]